PRRDVEFAAEDRLNARRPGVLVEVDCAEQVAVVGQRDGGEFELASPLDQTAEPRSAVEEAVLRVDVQVDEGALSRHRGFQVPAPGWGIDRVTALGASGTRR